MQTSANPTQSAIDQTLQLLFSDARRLERRLGRAADPSCTLAQLRDGPLGKDLARLALVAEGQADEAQDQVLTAIDSILQLLYWTAGADNYTVPRSFWETDLGRLFARAKSRAFSRSGFVGNQVAAERLGLSRRTVYRLTNHGSLDCAHDAVKGRIFVLRSGVDQLRSAPDMPFA